MKKLLLVLGMTAAMAAQAELVQQFKDPTFSGNGWSSQVLTLEQMRARALERVSMRTSVTAQDIAAQIVFICSKAGAKISGQSLSVDGNVETLVQ